MREHTEPMQLPRFLWVPFEFGHPFGAPHEPDFQRRVLRSALELLEREDGPVVLDDFPDDAPSLAPGANAGPSWECPVSFAPPETDDPELVTAALDEMRRLAPWHEVYLERGSHPAPTTTGLPREEVVKLLGRIAGGEAAPEAATALPLPEWIRLGCDELRMWYLEAARGQPGRATPTALRHWFWQQTAAAALIAAAASALLSHEQPLLRLLAGRALVPREYFATLLPAVDPAQSNHEGRPR